jgi:hypothetical protein
MGACDYIKQILKDLKGEMGYKTIVKDFNTPFCTMTSSKQKINK